MRDLSSFNFYELVVIREGLHLLLHAKGKTNAYSHAIALDLYRAVKQEILSIEIGDISGLVDGVDCGVFRRVDE